MQRKRVELLVLMSLVCLAIALIANRYRQQALQDQFVDAVARDDAPAVMALLDHGVDPIYRKPVGVTAIGLASSRLASRTLMALLKRGAKPVSEDLYHPAMENKKEMVEALLQAGADPNYDSPYTRPLLIELAARGNPAMLKLVIAHGGNVNGEHALSWVRPQGMSALMAAIRAKHIAAMNVLLDAGADVDARIQAPQSPTDGYTSLMMAAGSGQTDCVKLLLAHHADIALAAADGQTALSLAQQRHHTQILALLQQAAQNKMYTRQP